MMPEIIKYIIRFLLSEHVPSDTCNQVGYTSDPDEFHKYKLVILPSGFFDEGVYGTAQTLPALPLRIWEETPILFGGTVVDQTGETRLVHADLVASTYFLVSRYEEMVRRDVRDIHGRFPGKESLPYRAGFIDRPLVEEYGRLLRGQLRETGCEVPEPPAEIQKIYLTHDLDQIAHFRNVRGMLGGLLRGLKRPREGQKAWRSFFAGIRYDPWYTFPFLYKMNLSLIKKLGEERCESILFVRSGGGNRKEDKPMTNLIHPDFRGLIRYSKRKDVSVALHSSYAAGINPALILEEKKRLENHVKNTKSYNRHHFLDCREPEHMQALIDAGITDDFTMGYADMAGFRLGTCRPVKWIDPATRTLTPLTLHSLTIMDGSLSDKRYMYMNAHDAYQYCEQLINCVESYNGELVLLWHNTSVEKNAQSYHRKLYKDLTKFLESK
ncbi:MAG TPA: polysaccharide deacetylase family protein [Paludibacter sp.]|nr:polysaccharide deacetylase family protein [Paludibacter sp.]